MTPNFIPARGQRFEIGDGAALHCARAIALALLLDLDLAHGVAQTARLTLSRASATTVLELHIRESAEDPPLVRQMLVDALRGERRREERPGWISTPSSPGAAPLVEPDCCRLRLPQLVQPPRSPHPEFDGVGLEVAVLRLPRIGRHRDGRVEDVLDLVDSIGLGQRSAGAS